MTGSELVLRRLLWLRHGCPPEALYGDDGEMQRSVCLTDFKRDAVEAIEARFFRLGMERFAAQQAQAVQPRLKGGTS